MRNRMRLLGFITLLLLAACAEAQPANLAARDALSPTLVSSQPTGLDSGPLVLGTPPAKPGECPGLESAIFALVQDPDHAAEQAEALGYSVIDGKLKVQLILSAPDSDFLSAYGVQVGTQSGNTLDALVPFDQLCPLANLDAVESIRLSPRLSMP